MVKGWADHSSSDEEEEYHQEETEHFSAHVEHDVPGEGVGVSGQGAGPEPTLTERVYEYPTEPPYTAYVGNLAFSISDSSQFIEAMTVVVRDNLRVTMNFRNGRLLSDPHSNQTRHRGFGYIEVETVDDLQKLMELNKCSNPVIAGRRVMVDTSIQKSGNKGRGYNNHNIDRRRTTGSNSSRSITSTHSDTTTEGQKFRGGRHNNNSSNHNMGTRNTNQSVPAAPSTDALTPSSQRPVLKLKPRTKPLDGDKKPDADDTALEGTGSNSNIFGSAKARDEQSWRSQKQTQETNIASTETDTNRSNNIRHSNHSSSRPPTLLSSSLSTQQQPNRDSKRSGRGENRDMPSSGLGDGGGRSSTREGSGGRDSNHRSSSGRGGNSGRGSSKDAATDEYTKSEPRHYNKKKGMNAAVAESTPAVTVPPPKPMEPEKKIPAKPTNLFAALALDDSDSD